MKVLVIAPHPDDEVLGCGGVMARHSAEGDQLYVLVVTRGIPELFPPEVIEGTRLELKAAHEILGVKETIFLDFPAPKLDSTPGHEVADAIGKAIRRLEPEIVYLPHRGDVHSDHRAVYHATLVACRPVHNRSVKKLLCYETLSETEWSPPTGEDAFIPTVFMNIGDYLNDKLAAMACYKSQLQAPPNPRSLEALENLAKMRGSVVGLQAAEAFMLVREID
ncbi:MAG: PIG-L deacetylase family protein [Candidatus Promineifilaceae bacterium]